MRSLDRVPKLSLVPVLLCSVLSTHTAWADIYTYTGNDGAVNLSNVPTDTRYSVMIPEAKQAAPVVPSEAVQASIMASKVQYDSMVDEVARTYGLESALLHAVISVESRYRPRAVSKKGALGLMQLMPATAKRYGVADPLDPLQNLHGGAKHLRYLLNKFNNNRNLALAAYNAGEGAVERFGNRIPPYRETTSYVPRVMGFYRRYQLKS
jgi:soluble lytic murein transglycosylase-like protein